MPRIATIGVYRFNGESFVAALDEAGVTVVVDVRQRRGVRGTEYAWANALRLQSSLGAALKVSSERFMGTALGALVGGLVASYLPPNVAVFGGCIFVLGLVCALARSSYSAYRFGGITAAIVLLVPRSDPAWLAAFHRFAEVSIGIAVALILAWMWPEREAIPGNADRPKTKSHINPRRRK